MELETSAGAALRTLLMPGIVGLVLAWMLIQLDSRAPRLARRVLVGAGSVGTLGMAWLAAFNLGLTATLSDEREVVSFIRATYQDRPRVQAALRIADGSLYLSKGDAQVVAAAVLSN